VFRGCSARAAPGEDRADDAGPLYGLKLPTLISVSLAPGSYVVSAHAGLEIAAAGLAIEASILRLFIALPPSG
jgi:hypothetical protein